MHFFQDNRLQVQRPSIWVIDLETNFIVRRFEIPESIVQLGNGLASITVDVQDGNCLDAYAYIPDLATYRLYVYRLAFRRQYYVIELRIYTYFRTVYVKIGYGVLATITSILIRYMATSTLLATNFNGTMEFFRLHWEMYSQTVFERLFFIRWLGRYIQT